MSQIEVSKLNLNIALGAPADNAVVSKLNLYLILQPGDGGGEAERQGAVFTQIVRSA